MQEDIENRSVVLATQCTKMTGRVLAKLMRSALRKMKEAANAPKDSKPKVGKQSKRQLSKHGPLSSVEITEDNIKAFDPVARKHNVGYSLEKDGSSDPPRWMVFFSAKSADDMTAAFTEFSNKMLTREKDKPSTRKIMQNLQKDVKNVVKDKTRHKHREGPEL